jgi:hypothetical protein
MVAMMVRRIGSHEVRSRVSDKYVDATKLCKAAGKKWSHYAENQATQDFIQALAESTGIPTDSLVESRGGRDGGTWIHPRVAIHFAQWVNPQFAVAVSEWVLELLSTGRVEIKSPAPSGFVQMAAADFERLVGRMEHMQQQLDRLADSRALAPVSGLPRTTVQERLRVKGWPEANKKQRALIRKQANIWLMLRYGETPDMAAGPGAPCVYTLHQVAVLDEAIDYIRDAVTRREQERERRDPNLFSANHAA